jgi:2-deoxy-D-gluconate 3-dehydrogenase
MNLFDLSGKRAVVTGAGSPIGLGRAMAQALKQHGAEVAILSRSERVFDVAQEDGFVAVQADLSNRDELKRGFNEAVEKLGTLDVLINNHGITRVQESITFPIDAWDKMIETNLTSVFLLCQLAAPIMLAKHYGKIINIASIATFVGLTDLPSYVQAKGESGNSPRRWRVSGQAAASMSTRSLLALSKPK